MFTLSFATTSLGRVILTVVVVGFVVFSRIVKFPLLSASSVKIILLVVSLGTTFSSIIKSFVIGVELTSPRVTLLSIFNVVPSVTGTSKST